jgi:hypothetical protein
MALLEAECRRHLSPCRPRCPRRSERERERERIGCRIAGLLPPCDGIAPRSIRQSGFVSRRSRSAPSQPRGLFVDRGSILRVCQPPWQPVSSQHPWRNSRVVRLDGNAHKEVHVSRPTRNCGTPQFYRTGSCRQARARGTETDQHIRSVVGAMDGLRSGEAVVADSEVRQRRARVRALGVDVRAALVVVGWRVELSGLVATHQAGGVLGQCRVPTNPVHGGSKAGA